MRDYNCYLFDADGTLIDTVEMIYQCFVYTCGRFAGRAVSRQEVTALVGLPLKQTIEALFGPVTSEQYDEIRAAHMAFQLSIYQKHLRPFRQVQAGLQLLRDNGKKLGIVTSRMMATLGLYLETVGIKHYFTTFITPAETLRHKPEPEPVLEALRQMQATTDESIYIGDANCDIECGNRAGVDTAFVSWSHTPIEKLVACPTWCISSLTDLIVKPS